MEEEQKKPVSFTKVMHATLVVAFVWGSMWVGSHSYSMVGGLNSNLKSLLGKPSTMVAGVADSLPSNSPMPTVSTPAVTQPTPTSVPANSPVVTAAATPTSQPVSIATPTPTSVPTPTPTISLGSALTVSPTPTSAVTKSTTALTATPSPTPKTTKINPSPTPSPSPSPTPKANGTQIIKTLVGSQVIVATTSVSSATTNNASSTTASTLKIIVGGDVMMDRAVRYIGQKSGYDSLFEEIKPLFSSADLAVVNLEGPITSNPSKTLVNGHTTESLTFTFDPASTVGLAKAGINIVSLSNNHTDNFGLSGIAETKKWLAKSNITWFGDYKNASSSGVVVTKNNISVAFVGYHAFQPGFEKILASVADLSSKGHFVIVMPHWGTEYATSSTPAMRAQARLLVACGANAILGSHPHVIMDRVEMGDIPVFYSLGNLLFDQYFSKEVMKGNVVELDLSKKAGLTKLDKVRIYETSTASRQTININMTPMDF